MREPDSDRVAMNKGGSEPDAVGLRSAPLVRTEGGERRTMASLLMIIGVYIISSWLLREPGTYQSLSFLLPPDWWADVAGKSAVLGFLLLIINYRLRREFRGWDALGWSDFSIGRLGRELAWGLACASMVVIISELFLSSGRTPSNWAAAEQGVRIMDSAGAGKYAILALGTILTGINEELFYRGSFFAFMRSMFGGGRRGLTAFVVISSVVFATFHGLSSLGDYIVYAVMGAVFAVTLAASASLRAVVLAHILVNAFHTAMAIRLSLR